MIALAALVIVANLSNTRATVEKRILQVMCRWRNRHRHTPNHHFHDRTIVVIDALLE
jgi:hypothetical protein